MTGTAFRTAHLPMTELGPFPASRAAVVYALDPIWLSAWGFTGHVIVAADPDRRETCVYPSSAMGTCLSWEPLEVFGPIRYDAVLAAIGYRVVDLSRTREGVRGER